MEARPDARFEPGIHQSEGLRLMRRLLNEHFALSQVGSQVHRKLDNSYSRKVVRETATKGRAKRPQMLYFSYDQRKARRKTKRKGARREGKKRKEMDMEEKKRGEGAKQSPTEKKKGGESGL